MLKPFGENIWIVEGPVVTVAGFRYPTRMAVIKLETGGLFVWSPIALTDELRTAVSKLGKVEHIVAPNSLHHLSLGVWKEACPAAKLYAPPKLRNKRSDLEFDADLSDEAPLAWKSEIDQILVHGNLITTEVVFFHRKSGTILFADLLQNFQPGWFTGWRALVARWDRMTGDNPQVLQKFRVTFTGRKRAREAVRRILSWGSKQILMAHGTPVRDDAPAFLQRAFSWLRV